MESKVGVNVDAKQGSLGLLFAAGIAAGIFGGFSGVGGAIILIPASIALAGLTQHEAHGTSLAVIVPGALASALLYWLAPRDGLEPPFFAVVLLTIPAVIGAPLGARLVTLIPQDALRRLFGVLLLGVSAKFLLPDPWGTMGLVAGLVTLGVGTSAVLIRKGAS